jgi:hypothetical protein
MTADRQPSRVACPEQRRGACPEQRRGETLDEAIDRVAQSLTAVPADPSFATRLQSRIQARPRIEFNVLAGTLATAALAVFVLVLWGTGNVSMIETDRTAAVLPATPPPAAITPSPIAPPVASRVSAPTTENGTAPAYEIGDVAAPTIAPLPAPQLLAVEALRVVPLTVAVVEVEALELTDLTLAPIDAPEERE